MRKNDAENIIANIDVKLDDKLKTTLENLSSQQIKELQKIRDILRPIPRRTSRRVPIKSKKSKDPFLIFEVFAEIIKEWIELQKIKEIEKTKRLLIQTKLENLKQATELYIQTFNKIFYRRYEERQKVLDKFLEIYMYLAERNNWQALNIVGQQILHLLSTPIISHEEKEMLENIFSLSIQSIGSLNEKLFELEELPDYLEI